MWDSILCLFLFVISWFQGVQATQVENNDWDYLIVSQRWLPSECIDYVSKHPFATCSMPSNPNSWGYSGPRLRKENAQIEFCNSSWPFDRDSVVSIEACLHQHWKNIEDEGKDYQLWADEWEKIGTCLTKSDEYFDNQLKFFTNAIQFMKNFPMLIFLEQRDITPSYKKLYSLDEINDAILIKFRQPFIECREIDGKQYLFEIKLCLSRDLFLIDCEFVFGKSSSGCPEGGIAYPLSNTLPIKTKTWSVVKAYELATNAQLFNSLYNNIV